MTSRGQRMAEGSRSLPLRVDVAIVMGWPVNRVRPFEPIQSWRVSW